MYNRLMDISIVIVTWNCKEYARECLISIEEQIGEFSREIIVVDNASSDGTADMIAATFPHVQLIRSACNLGFAAANNLGIPYATGRYTCLINPDVKLYPSCLQSMLHYMDQEPSIGLLGPQMIGPDGKVGRSTMRFPTVWNSLCRALALDCLFKNSRIFGGFLMRDFRHNTVEDVDILNGWFWMARQSALEEVGVLDPKLFMYGDDLDWCRRYHNARWRVVFYSEAAAVHYGGGTTAKAPIPFYIALQKANFQYWEKHYGRIPTAGYFLLTCLHHLMRIVGFGIVYMTKHAARYEASYKVKRSLAAILWLTGIGSNRLGEVR